MDKDTPNVLQKPAWPCTSCSRQSLTESDFKKKSENAWQKTCQFCLTSQRKSRAKGRAKRLQDKENQPPTPLAAAANPETLPPKGNIPVARQTGSEMDDGLPEEDVDEDAASKGFSSLTPIPLDSFINALDNMSSDETEIYALVNIATLKSESGAGPKALADRVAELVWNETKYRFVYVLPHFACLHVSLEVLLRSHKIRPMKRDSRVRFSYYCSQYKKRQQASRKSKKDGASQCDKLKMVTFDCKGWLYIYLDPLTDSDVAQITYKHCLDHIPYWCIDVPEEIRKLILDNLEVPFADAGDYLRPSDYVN